jgi:hypothetical protein
VAHRRGLLVHGVPVTDPFTAFRAAIETDDVDAAVALFAEDVTFHSPVVHKPYVGREPLRAVLRAVATVFEDFRYTGSYGGDDGHVLRFSARVGDRELEGVDLLRGSDGVLTELTVMVRPYSAATALRERMAALLL